MQTVTQKDYTALGDNVMFFPVNTESDKANVKDAPVTEEAVAFKLKFKLI